jgi:serine/threonine-protein kinase
MRYRLIERLGEGGMAEVWRGFDEVLDRQVAIKLVGSQGGALRTEALAGAGISHPHIVHVHDYGEWTDGRPFVVMELLEGRTLSSVLNGGFSLPWRKAVAVCAQIASALAAAHARGIVHRDVSTGNVMLTPTGARLLDFGIAAVAGGVEPARGSGDLQGTPAFMAPERLRGGAVAPASDVYALGVLFYRTLSGRLPWPVHTQAELLDAHLWLEPAPLPRIPGLPATVAELCLRCLAKDPGERPSTAEVAMTLGPIARLPMFVAPPARPSAADTITTTPLPADPEPTVAAIRQRTRILPPLRGFVPSPTVAMAPPTSRPFAVIVGGLLASTLGIFAWGVPGPQRPASWSPGPPDPAACRVTYQQQTGAASSFSAVLTVQNDGAEPVSPWQVEFAWPGDQTLLGAQGVDARQQGRDVVLRGDRLDPGGMAEINLSGSYGQINALPSQFSLAGSSCETVILGSPPVEPAIQVASPNVRPADDDHRGKHKKMGK